MDLDRRKWTKFLYDLDWAEPSLYDVVINLEQITLQEACDLICFASQQKCFEFTPERRRALDDLAMASRVKANLALDTATSDCQFEVVAESGSVSVKGEIIGPAQAKKISEIVRAVPGVQKVDLQQLQMVTRR
jgi:hypothetical protein